MLPQIRIDWVDGLSHPPQFIARNQNKALEKAGLPFTYMAFEVETIVFPEQLKD